MQQLEPIPTARAWNQRREKMKEIKEEAAKHGFEMVYWGSPYGVDKNVCVVWMSEKPLEAYIDFHSTYPSETQRRTQ